MRGQEMEDKRLQVGLLRDILGYQDATLVDILRISRLTSARLLRVLSLMIDRELVEVSPEESPPKRYKVTSKGEYVLSMVDDAIASARESAEPVATG